MAQDPIAEARDAQHIDRSVIALTWLTRFVQGMIARFRPSEIELALTVLLARVVRTAYPARTRAELAEHVRHGVLEALEHTDDPAPEQASANLEKRGN